jgi:hypothetical protein
MLTSVAAAWWVCLVALSEEKQVSESKIGGVGFANRTDLGVETPLQHAFKDSFPHHVVDGGVGFLVRPGQQIN